MDEVDRRLINALQGGFPICDRPYAEVGRRLGLEEDDVIARLERLLEDGVLSRFGPMYDAERLGGGLTLAAMAVPEDRLDEVAGIVGIDGLLVRTGDAGATWQVQHGEAETHQLEETGFVADEAARSPAKAVPARPASASAPTKS